MDGGGHFFRFFGGVDDGHGSAPAVEGLHVAERIGPSHGGGLAHWQEGGDVVGDLGEEGVRRGDGNFAQFLFASESDLDGWRLFLGMKGAGDDDAAFGAEEDEVIIEAG